MARISEQAHRILNDPERIARRDLWFSRLSDLFDGRENEYNRTHLFTLHGAVPRPADDQLAYTDPEAWINACIELCAACPDHNAERFAPICVEYPIYGVHFIDKMFGADVFFQDGQWNARYLTTPVGSLQMPDLEKDETWQLARRAAQAFLDADVALPLFGLPTLSSALNIFVNLYGEEGLFTMLDDEDAAMHDLTVINDLIRSLHRWYLTHIPLQQLQPVISWDRTQPPGYGQLCGCTSQLVSGDMYARMIAPLDDALLAEYPHGGMIHLCGAHEQLLPTFRSMPHLRSLQLNDRATQTLPQYLAELREDQILYVNHWNPATEPSVEELLTLPDTRRIVSVRPGSAPVLK